MRGVIRKFMASLFRFAEKRPIHRVVFQRKRKEKYFLDEIDAIRAGKKFDLSLRRRGVVGRFGQIEFLSASPNDAKVTLTKSISSGTRTKIGIFECFLSSVPDLYSFSTNRNICWSIFHVYGIISENYTVRTNLVGGRVG